MTHDVERQVNSCIPELLITSLQNRSSRTDVLQSSTWPVLHSSAHTWIFTAGNIICATAMIIVMITVGSVMTEWMSWLETRNKEMMTLWTIFKAYRQCVQTVLCSLRFWLCWALLLFLLFLWRVSRLPYTSCSWDMEYRSFSWVLNRKCARTVILEKNLKKRLPHYSRCFFLFSLSISCVCFSFFRFRLTNCSASLFFVYISFVVSAHQRDSQEDLVFTVDSNANLIVIPKSFASHSMMSCSQSCDVQRVWHDREVSSLDCPT